MIRRDPEGMPADVAAAFRAFPALLRHRLERLRALVQAVAREADGVGPLLETLKWGEPAYLTQAPGSGSTKRLGSPKGRPGHAAIYFSCKTTLVATFRNLFSDRFGYSGARAILLDVERPYDEDALRLCISMALTYHLAKTAKQSTRVRRR